MNIASVLVIFGTVRMCPGDKIGTEMPSKLKGKKEKRAPSTRVVNPKICFQFIAIKTTSLERAFKMKTNEGSTIS